MKVHVSGQPKFDKPQKMKKKLILEHQTAYRAGVSYKNDELIFNWKLSLNKSNLGLESGIKHTIVTTDVRREAP